MASSLHDRLLTIDSHIDIEPHTFRADCNYTRRLRTQVDLPKMEEGGLDVAFFIAYTAQGALTEQGYANAYRKAIAKVEAIHRLTDDIAPSRIGLALTPDDVVRIAGSGRKVAVIGVENGYPMGTDLARLSDLYERGARYMSLTHNGDNQLCDSHTSEATGDALHGGLSAFGVQVIAEMTRLGMMIDVSHLAKTSMLEAAELARAPIIASHSAARTLSDSSRNLDDEQLLALQKTGGVIQVVAYPGFLRADDLATTRAAKAEGQRLQAEYGVERRPGELPEDEPEPVCPEVDAKPVFHDTAADQRALAALSAADRASFLARAAAIRAAHDAAMRATVKDLVDHIDYVVQLIGIDHVGISSDFEGGGGVSGWQNAAETPNVTAELVARGYSEAEMEKIWGGNLLRVWRDVEAVASLHL